MVQAAGQQAMETLQKHLHALAQGDPPAPAPRRAGRCSLVLGADGAGPVSPDGWSADREDPMARSQSRESVGRLEPASHAHRQGHHPAAPASAGGGLGDIEALKPRLWLGSRAPGHQHGPQVVCLCGWRTGLMAAVWRSSWRRLWASWTSPRCAVPVEGGRRLGWTAAPPGRVGGLGWAQGGPPVRHGPVDGVWADLVEALGSRACLTPRAGYVDGVCVL